MKEKKNNLKKSARSASLSFGNEKSGAHCVQGWSRAHFQQNIHTHIYISVQMLRQTATSEDFTTRQRRIPERG